MLEKIHCRRTLRFFDFDKNLLSLEVSIGKLLLYVKEIFDKNLLSLEVSIGKPGLYVKKILPQNVVLDTDGHAGDTSRD